MPSRMKKWCWKGVDWLEAACIVQWKKRTGVSAIAVEFGMYKIYLSSWKNPYAPATYANGLARPLKASTGNHFGCVDFSRITKYFGDGRVGSQSS